MNQTIYKDDLNNQIRLSSVSLLESACPFAGVGIKYVVSGEEIYHANDRRFSVGQGVYMLGNDFTEAVVQIRQKEPAQGLCIDISSQIVAEVAQHHDLHGADLQEFLLSDQLLVNCYETNNTRLGACLRELSTRIKAGRFDGRAERYELFYSLADSIVTDQRFVLQHLRKMDFKKTETNEEVFRAVICAKSFMDAHIFEELSLDQVCQHAGMSKYHFIRVFRKAFGLSPYQYQIHKRLENARRELLQGKSIRDIALRHGYADVAAFSKAFKQAFGQAPGALRNSNF